MTKTMDDGSMELTATEADALTLVAELVLAVREIAEASPYSVTIKDEVGGGCYYDERSKCSNGACGCIVGQGMQLINWPFPRDFEEEVTIDSILEHTPGMNSGSRITRWTRWLTDVQTRQDKGVYWRRCIVEADYTHQMALELDTLRRAAAGERVSPLEGDYSRVY